MILHKHTELTADQPLHHEDPKLFLCIANGPRISSQEKQTSYHRLNLGLKSNNVVNQLGFY